MHKLGLFSLVLVLALCVVPVFGQGNGIPKDLDKLYSIQIIAYDKDNCPQQDSLDTSRHQIAVAADVGTNHPDRQLMSELVRDNDILLAPGPFRVLDGNACKDGVASFQLPDPAAEGGGSTSISDPTFAYAVWIRLVGKPLTGIDVATCATDAMGTVDTADDIVRCSVENVELTRTKKSAPKFVNRSKELLSICVDTSEPADGVCDARYPLFATALQGYWWDWGTDGKAHAQLVFTEAPEE
ncbi:MAG: hypothetical protein ABFD89_26095 [Bryobacteraceae bacterium]